MRNIHDLSSCMFQVGHVCWHEPLVTCHSGEGEGGPGGGGGALLTSLVQTS